ncbi:Hsp20/alpha crystallin family protein [Alteraurantiacibacter aestuarii]|uniref:Hsp20/alpha crystallin family protein n=1 Tax=Alteraurantiacibacter aestuarii TaxID=650004 RepID=UPI0031DA9E07
MGDSTTLPATRSSGLTQQFLEPLNRLRGEIDRMFDEFPARWPSLHLPARFTASLPVPAVGMTENKKGYKVSVEVPGIEPEAIELQVEKDMLIIKGEKTEEREEEERDYALSERSYGAFERRIAMPADAMADKIEAKAKNGVLEISIPRDKEAVSERRRIEIKSAKK